VALRLLPVAKVTIMPMRVLLTGGAGYIGSHTAVELQNRNHDVIILDNFANSSPVVLERIYEITGKRPILVEADLTDLTATRFALQDVEFDSAIHFAGLKAVGESVQLPLDYYRVNLDSTIVLLEILAERDVKKFVFSSSATVYGDPQQPRITENHSVGIGITSPYGWSKAMNEQIIRDAASARTDLSAILLRYFNPVGAHSSGRIGEDPSGLPNNLMPFVLQVAVGRRNELSIFGGDYPTVDGSGVRDYIHVVDLALGHVAALEYDIPGAHAVNLGTGVGTSVLEAIRTFEHVTGARVPYNVVARRPGDVAEVVADPTLALEMLGWKGDRSFADACRDGWTWQSTNPNGYQH
jgi:UDP-glucose 4-epimerase